ncbi:hypothetical protein D1007_01815 [Hordeum vulgare]|nr:hypothetical protein D1007_01815 [Hordeum vulgare]
MLVDVVRERGAAGMRRDRQRDVVAMGEDGGDGEHMGRPGLSWSLERTDPAAPDILDILSGDEVRGGYGIDDGMAIVLLGRCKQKSLL